MYVGQCSLNCFHSLVQIFYSYFQFLVWNIVLLSDFWGFFFNGEQNLELKLALILWEKRKKKQMISLRASLRSWDLIASMQMKITFSNHLSRKPPPPPQQVSACLQLVILTARPQQSTLAGGGCRSRANPGGRSSSTAGAGCPAKAFCRRGGNIDLWEDFPSFSLAVYSDHLRALCTHFSSPFRTWTQWLKSAGMIYIQVKARPKSMHVKKC